MAWDFQIVQVTAAGTFGTVCVAFDWTSRRFYALKVLKDRFKHNRKVLTRTHDEATMLAKIEHPNILKVYEMLEVDERPVVVMEWVQGCSLQDLVDCHPEGIDGRVSLELIRQSARALHAAYSAPSGATGAPMHIIHRDIKPSNILLSLQGGVKVVDFGIARGDFEGKRSETVSMVLGARAYMAPERLDGAPDGPRLDVYALGLVFYELLKGDRIKLSMRPNVHARQMADALAALEIRGLSPAGEKALRDLLGHMTTYDRHKRPDAVQVEQRALQILNHEGGLPDMERFANDHVRPIFEANSLIDPRATQDYEELAFLDAMGPTRPGGDPAIDAKLRRFLATPGWAARVEELWTLLLLNPSWTAEPFIEWLDKRKAQWWQFWQQNTATVPQKIALLRILACRFDDDVRRRVMRFKADPNPRVRKLAEQLLTAEEVTGF
ncbi:MAG: serine/threonine protein kinase [Alphaproteobacteria bacterium]|nr:serine/threonine protein kinase [Alphaproteobacteria bacterium]